jgi:Ser/Thr protein kinase RdoA (MazF antagonist)
MSGAASSAGHLVHGMGITPEAPTWPPILPDEAEAVLTRFVDAGPMEALRWHSPRPFSAAALVDTTRGSFILKRHHRRVRTCAGLAEEHGFIAHLARAGIPVPEVMRAADGTGAVAVDDWTYELHRESAGADLYRDRLSWTPFLSHAHAHAAGAALARMHIAAKGHGAAARRVQPLVASFTILPAADPMAAAEAYVTARPALAAYLAGWDWRRELARLFAVAGKGLAERLAAQGVLWTHNDWHPSNLLWDGDGDVRTAFDFGLADRTCAAHDLAIAIERSAVGWLELGEGRDEAIGDPGAALALLAGYAGVRPLGRKEIATIIRLLPLVHIEFALSEVDYFAGVVAEPGNAALAWEGYLIGHAEWFLAGPGRDFLRGIEGGAGR